MDSTITFDTVVPRLFKALPPLLSQYEAKFGYMLDEQPLAYLVFGSILIPSFERALDHGNDHLANSIGLFLEDASLSSKGDAELANLLLIEVGEWLGGTTREAKAAEFLGPETRRACRYVPGLAMQRNQLGAERAKMSLGRRFISILSGR